MTGRHAIAEGHRGLFGGVLKGSRLYAEIEDLSFPAPGIAVVHSRGADGRWLIRAFQNTRHRPRVEAFSNWPADRLGPRGK